MTTTAQTLITRAAAVLNDEANVRWTVSEMLGWLADGQREAAVLNPTLYTKTAVRTLVAGAHQTLSDIADYGMLASVTRNLAFDGVTSGRSVTAVDEALVMASDPMWQTATPSPTVYHYMFDQNRRFSYRVQPPAMAGTKVEILYAAIPPAVASATDPIALQDHCVPALVDYLCFRALSKDAEFGDVPTLAAGYHKLFTEAVKAL